MSESNKLFPTNISKEDLLKAIEKIDQESIPKNSDSNYYDVIFNGKKYPPKVIVSFANLFANGEILDRESFPGGLNTPCFKLLESNGFIIKPKKTNKMDEQVMVYCVSSSASANAVALTSSDKQYFYWNDKTFKSLQMGDYVFVVNVEGKKVLYTKLDTTEIPTKTNDEGNTYFTDLKKEYTVSGKYEKFVRLKVIQELNVLPNWKWKSLGSSEKTYLNGPKINLDKGANRILNINQLKELSGDEGYNNILNACLLNFKEGVNIVNAFETITKSAGLIFSKQLIRRFTASLCTKPFVILSGLSGSGKTKLAQSFVQWICEDEKQYKIVPVGADWTNREPLLGYPNGLVADEYITPDSGVIHLLMEAVKEENEKRPFFLILDEMNLSHVERYFADFLSIMESNDTIKLYTGTKRKSLDGLDIDLEIGWPKNVFIIGTVNIDETTYMFSPKVLDRANVIEFRISDNEIQSFLNEPFILKLDNLKGGGTALSESFMMITHSEDIVKNDEIAKELLLFFSQLQSVGAEFGYRSASEILLLIAKLKLLEPKIKTNESLDIAIMQKLLPKLHGSRSKLVKILIALSALCVENIDKGEFKKKFDDNYNNNFIGLKIKYPISFEKIIRMYKNVLANGFTSYAEA